ncbi:MAG: hypothetical protein KDI90_01910 [Alphaproteobacteria bacterium]|nr:hypothetical protein [Alphaproteobacteria bacterium]MCB9975194.1 hypothetical protein [Rhodospirillales bacterium]
MSGHDEKYSYDLKVGDEIAITDPETHAVFTARVVGADTYNEVTAAFNHAEAGHGLKNRWVSYTLTSEDAPEHWGRRFWAVDSQKADESGAPRLPDVQRAFYVASDKLIRPNGYEFEDRMSGRVDLSVAGEALHSVEGETGTSVAIGTLFTFRNPESGDIWAEEVFLDDQQEPQRMVFEAKFDVPFEKVM